MQPSKLTYSKYFLNFWSCFSSMICSFIKKSIFQLFQDWGEGRKMYILLEYKWGPSMGYGLELSIWFL